MCALSQLRCAIVTFHFVRNFGALWQAYALRAFLKKEGVEAVFVDYRPSHVEKGAVRESLARGGVKAAGVSLYLKLQRCREEVFGCHGQADKFRAFAANHLPTTPQTYRTHRELLDSPPQADVLLCGSDQIWHHSRQFGYDSAYFLAFGESVQRRVSYAASFGGAKPPPHTADQLTSWLRRLDAISVRERSGAEVVRELTGINATVTPDPTVLLGDFTHFITSHTNEPPSQLKAPYVLSYALRHSSHVEAIAEAIAAEKGLSHFSVHARRLSPFASKQKLFPGPEEWLQLIHNAAYVVTNSFHGTIFSTLFKKQFLSVAISGKKSIYNDRATQFLIDCGLERRIYRVRDASNIISTIDSPVDWSSVDSRVASMRAVGADFLRTHVISS